MGFVDDGMANARRSDEWLLIERLESKWRDLEYRDNTQKRRAGIPQNSTACSVMMHYSDSGILFRHHLHWRQIFIGFHIVLMLGHVR